MNSIPKNFILSLASTLKVLIFSRFRGMLRSTTKRKEKLLILGNGPSLSETVNKNAALFDNYDLMSVNNMSLTDLYVKLKPKWYILHAFIYYVPDSELDAFYQETKRKTLSAIIQKTDWEMEILVPFQARKSPAFLNTIAQNPKLKLIYYNQTPVEGFQSVSNFFFGKGWGMPRPHNVLIPSLMSGILLGYKEICLAGADHSWLSEISVNEKNEALVNQKHFYDENTAEPAKMNDWKSRPRRLHEILHKFYLSFKGYWELKPFAESKGVNIYNVSEVSMIDAFERKSLS